MSIHLLQYIVQLNENEKRCFDI